MPLCSRCCQLHTQRRCLQAPHPAMLVHRFAAAPAQPMAGELPQPASGSNSSGSRLASLFQPTNLLAGDAGALLAHYLAR